MPMKVRHKSDGSPLYVAGEAAEIIGRSNNTLKRWEKKGLSKPLRLPPSGNGYYDDELMERGKKIAEEMKNKITKANKIIFELKGDEYEC